jgi:GntR family transcriptional regulator/MocR family aminotransferase
MRQRSSAFPLVLAPRARGTEAGRWLYDSLQREILSGRLRAGVRLPATRDLARQYNLSRGTIVAAFERLKSEGYLEGRTGSGTFVGQVPGSAAKPATSPLPRRLSRYAARLRPFPALGVRPTRAFRANQPALDLFPTTLWARIASRRMRRAATGHLEAGPALGYPPLREAIADYLVTSRGVRCTPDQVAIVSGAQEAIDLVARLVLDAGDRVAMENPGYIGASLVFEALGARIVPIRLDQEGMELRSVELKEARLIYVTPAHQFPLGVSMSLPRRLELLELCRRTGGLILEDDYDSEYRYSGRPLPALQGLDQHGVVLFSGSFSKVLFPSLRLGYLVVPPDLIESIQAAESITNRHAPTLEQAVLCDFMAAGHFARHIRRMREVYAERLGILLEQAADRLGGLLEVSGVEAGLQTIGWLKRGIPAAAAASAAGERRVEVTPISSYARGGRGPQALHLGFAAVDGPEIRRGVRDLAAALESLVAAS